MEVQALAAQDKVVVTFVPCLLHILHRSVLPALQVHNCVNELYRAGHVLQVASFWLAIVNSARQILNAGGRGCSGTVVLHNDMANDHVNHLVAKHLLQLTPCEGLPDDHVSSRTLRLRDELLDCFRGDWRLGIVQYKCPL